MGDQEMRDWVDSQDYETLLRRWRFAPVGDDPMFRGRMGLYYKKVMFAKKDANPKAAVQISKKVGWKNDC